MDHKATTRHGPISGSTQDTDTNAEATTAGAALGGTTRMAGVTARSSRAMKVASMRYIHVKAKGRDPACYNFYERCRAARNRRKPSKANVHADSKERAQGFKGHGGSFGGGKTGAKSFRRMARRRAFAWVRANCRTRLLQLRRNLSPSQRLPQAVGS